MSRSMHQSCWTPGSERNCALRLKPRTRSLYCIPASGHFLYTSLHCAQQVIKSASWRVSDEGHSQCSVHRDVSARPAESLIWTISHGLNIRHGNCRW
jgi:hypothetical protein